MKNSERKIRAVTFDAGGTLLFPSQPVGMIYAEVAASCGVTLDAGKLDAAFKSSFRAVPPVIHRGAGLTSSSKDWWRNLVRTVLFASGQFARVGGEAGFETFFESVYGEFLKPARWHINEPLMQIVRDCRRAGIKTAVLSNWDERLRPILQATGLEPFFDCIIVSCEVGIEKPDTRIFAVASERLGIPPAQIAHVGDSQREDCEGAAAAGMSAVLIAKDSFDPRKLRAILGLEGFGRPQNLTEENRIAQG
ncbi:HAD-IA family hydrolase [Kamptonema cortianum]|nr:HAD-IA family hydrolase [Kamptonema cortianum]MDL5044525.1 HAD-IA family hydrolase [Oscillatoria amoena NRMC-F 0135]